MHWLDAFDLFLFDFDGLLVDTERLHFQAYQRLCRDHGYLLPWTFEEYCSIAHSAADGLRRATYHLFPELERAHPDWATLYAKKKGIYLELLDEGNLQLMPGVALMLKNLEERGIRRAVATNSPKEQIEQIRKLLPELDTIPEWVTREDYAEPKPAPDAYLKAIERVGRPGDRVIGFEDSLRGLEALQATPALAVLIAPSCPRTLGENTLYFSSMTDALRATF